MNINEYIEKTQPILNKILLNYKNNSVFPHALLINGTLEVSMLDVALYISKSFYCLDKSKLVCDECQNCNKINNNEYINMEIIDGENKSILKNEINSLISEFSKTSIEDNNHYIYIINHVEKMTLEAVNALLKFLEEPVSNVTAILTTKNLSKVLPTIRSRCQTINLLPINKKNIIENSIKLEIDQGIAEILSFFYIDENKIKEASLDKSNIDIINNTLEYLNLLTTNVNKAQFVLLNNLIPILSTNESLEFFLNLILIFLEESIKYKFKNETTLKTNENLIKNLYNNLDNIDNSILEIIKLKDTIYLNINKSLILERMHFVIKGNK